MSKLRFKATLNVEKFTNNIEKISKRMEQIIEKAKVVLAIQMLTYMNTGSPREPIKPPIRWGVLRGSSSVFVGTQLVGAGIGTKGNAAATPAMSYPGKNKEITVVYNTEYAAKMHEWGGGWGAYTKQDGNAGAKWVEKHIIADGPLLLAIFAEEVKRATG